MFERALHPDLLAILANSFLGACEEDRNIGDEYDIETTESLPGSRDAEAMRLARVSRYCFHALRSRYLHKRVYDLSDIHARLDPESAHSHSPYGIGMMSRVAASDIDLVKKKLPIPMCVNERCRITQVNLESCDVAMKDGHDEMWPPALTSLTLPEQLPTSLLRLHLPSTLTYLNLRDWKLQAGYVEPASWSAMFEHIGAAAPNLMTLVAPARYKGLPLPSNLNELLPHLEELDLRGDLGHGDVRGAFSEPIENVNWPPKLKRLRFGWFDQPIEGVKLPHSLTHLSFNEFDHPLEGVHLPPQLECLQLGRYFNHPIERVQWPQPLRILNLSSGFNQPIESLQLPPSLQVLHLGRNFNQPIQRIRLPPSLTKLFLSNAFNQPIEGLQLPSKLRFMRFPSQASFNQPISNLHLPPSLTSLHLPYDYDQPPLSSALSLPDSLHELNAAECVIRGLILANCPLPPSLSSIGCGIEINACSLGIRSIGGEGKMGLARLCELADCETLSLANNQLTQLPTGPPFHRTFSTKLQSLDLSGNQLTSLPDVEWSGMTQLITLDVSKNRLTSLPHSLLALDTELTINVEGNPFTADEKFHAILQQCDGALSDEWRRRLIASHNGGERGTHSHSHCGCSSATCASAPASVPTLTSTSSSSAPIPSSSITSPSNASIASTIPHPSASTSPSTSPTGHVDIGNTAILFRSRKATKRRFR